uniref:SOWAHA-C winged helix-turn-helix domain-containing protein n=1 Tax=Sinocyclocheilus rhinocerous TaxID=307959 RepID=A0A673G3A5_9TELE
MATDFTQDSVLRFIINNGGTVRNADLLTHYKRFLREDEGREQNRELFKRYVNSVATVRQEEGVSHVVLRKKYRVHLGDVAKNREPERDSKQAVSGKPQAALTIPTCVEILPVAGILTNNNNDSTPSFEKAVRTSSPHGREQPSVSTSCEKQVNDTCPLKPTPSDTDSRSNGSGQSYEHKHSSIPLDPREHDWFVKAASGTWTDIYALFRDDPNLLSKRDFISGFTVVHWIAKHGDHRVLNTLWYGVDKVGMTLDVNAKTLGGYTPLHLAAIHGHKKVIRLLVQKFKADVRIRDSSGKRPWQYLSKDEQRDILELLGAPQKRISGSPAMPANLSTRPATTKVNVKRHTSIAALFKHNSHLRVSSGPEALF